MKKLTVITLIAIAFLIANIAFAQEKVVKTEKKVLVREKPKVEKRQQIQKLQTLKKLEDGSSIVIKRVPREEIRSSELKKSTLKNNFKPEITKTPCAHGETKVEQTACKPGCAKSCCSKKDCSKKVKRAKKKN